MIKIAAIFSFVASLYAGMLYGRGLSFQTNDQLITNRTSYDLFDGMKTVGQDSVCLAFDVAFFDTSYYGHILNVENDAGDHYSLVLVTFRSKDSLYLDLNAGKSQDKISIPLSKSYCRENIWHRIYLCWDFQSRQVRMQLNGQTRQILADDCNDVRKMSFVFGRSLKYNDVPAMTLRNVRFFDGSRHFEFPLSESSGNEVHDVSGKSYGVVSNPQWRSYYHLHWKELCQFESSEIIGVSYDSISSALFFYSTKGLKRINLAGDSKQDQTILFEPPGFRINSGGMLYLPQCDSLLLYNIRLQAGDNCNFAMIDSHSGKMRCCRLKPGPNKLHHHNLFVDRDNRHVYVFGGYGSYSYSNRFYTFNRTRNAISRVAFGGDTIIPRFFAACGADFSQGRNEVYLFGGFGNESGRQEDGGRNLYDCYKVDLNTRTVRKLFSKINSRQDEFVPASDLIVMPEEKAFYAFCYPHHLPSSNGYIYRFAMDGSHCERMSEAVPVLSEKIETNLRLFFDRNLSKFILVKQEFKDPDHSIVRVHTVSYPFVQEEQQKAAGFNVWLVWLSVILLSSIAGLAYWKIRSSRQLGETEAVDDSGRITVHSPSENQHDGFDSRLPDRSAVYLLGNFTVFDRQGQDITFRFSAKIRQLFLLILLHSLSDRKGISSDAMSAILWPDKDTTKAKNIRGVTIKNLREVLAEIDGIELVKENNLWQTSIDSQKFHCDYLLLLDLNSRVNLQQPEDLSHLQEYIPFFERGNLLETSNYSWADPFKSAFEELATDLLLPLLSYSLKNKDFSLTLHVASVLLKTDPLNEEIFAFEYEALLRLGRHKQARLKRSYFEQEFFKAYNREPNISNF